MYLRDRIPWKGQQGIAPSRIVNGAGGVGHTIAKLQVPKWALTDIFDLPNRILSNVRAVEAALQEHMTSNLWNYLQTVFTQVKQGTNAYQLDVDGDIFSLRTSLTQSIRSMCAQIT